jgi:hypothetical protein
MGVAVALLADAPQQLELGTATTAALSSLGARVAPVADAPAPPPRRSVVARSAAVVVTGIAWLAQLSLPYAEPFPDLDGR